MKKLSILKYSVSMVVIALYVIFGFAHDIITPRGSEVSHAHPADLAYWDDEPPPNGYYDYNSNGEYDYNVLKVDWTDWSLDKWGDTYNLTLISPSNTAFNCHAYAWASGADLQKAADQYDMIIVSLTAWYNFYVDYENDSTQQNKKYKSYVLEVIQIVDDNYDTGKSRAYRAISGISNGGKGAIYIASKHPDMFISASSLSGGFYPGFPLNYENLKSINLLIDVGEDDVSVLSNNRTLHKNLLNYNIKHIYRETPGGHDWRYWGAHYEEHFRFHSESFQK